MDVIWCRSAQIRRNHKPEENERIIVGAWAIVAVASVAVAEIWVSAIARQRLNWSGDDNR